MGSDRDGEQAAIATTSESSIASDARTDRAGVPDARDDTAERAATDESAAIKGVAERYLAANFTVHVSLRYLAKRRSFFDFLHAGSKALSAIFGGAAFFSLIGSKETTIALWVTAALAVVSAVDTTFGFATRARRMDTQYRRFSDLAAEMEVVTPDALTEKRLRTLRAKLLTIERDDPTPLTALNILCHNEEALARGYGHTQIYHVGWLRSLLAHWWTFSSFEPETVADRKAAAAGKAASNATSA